MEKPACRTSPGPDGPGCRPVSRPPHAPGRLLVRLSRVAVLAVALVPTPVRPAEDESVATPVGRVSYARVDPIVIRPGVIPAWVQVGVPIGFGVVSVVITPPANSLTKDGVPVDVLTLRDDGFGGDPIPNDGNFTVTGVGIDHPEGLLGIVDMRVATPIELHHDDGTVESFQQDLGLAFRYLDASIPDVTSTRYAPDVAASPRVVSMIPQHLVHGFPIQTFLPNEVARRYYDFFPDDRDFLIVEYGFSQLQANGQEVTIRNDVEGIFDPEIRTPIYDESWYYGSAGVLQAMITTWRGLAAQFGLLNHEFLHRWAHYLGMGLYSPGGHGGLIVRPSGGFGSFQDIEEIAPNTFRTYQKIPGDHHYSDYELYLAGLIPLEAIEWPIKALINPVKIENEICPPELAPCSLQIWSADELREITQADFLAAFGPRNPDVSSSRKNFRSGLIVLYDRILTNSELTYYEFGLQEYEKRSSDVEPTLTFHEVTGGLATLSTRLFCEDLDGDTVCDDVDDCPTIPNPDQDPEVCDQQIVDVAVDLHAPDGQGAGVVHWRTTHEVSLVGFDVVMIDPAGHRTVVNPDPISCEHCDTGEGHEYSFVVPHHRGGRHVYIEGICADGCVGPWGPATTFPAGGSIR